MTALEAARAIRECIVKNGGGKNDAALREITALVNQIRWGFSRASYETGNVLGSAEILFSVRKHERYGGVDRVRSNALEDCERLITKLEQLERLA